MPSAPRQVLLLTIGSAGDVHPFIGIGLAMQRRGHHVKILTNPYFQPLVEKAGLGFVALGRREDFTEIRDNPDLWHRKKGPITVFNSIGQNLRATYQTLMDHYVKGETVVAASSLALAARVAEDKHGLAMATVHLQPAVLRSVYQSPVLPGMFMPSWMPRWMKGAIWTIGDRAVIDPLICPMLNAFRAELGLSPVRRVLDRWWHSPQRVIGLFPEWFAPPQPDWPPQTRLTGFPLYDEAGLNDLPEDLRQFLDDGDPPIAFTPGSAMLHGQQFFLESTKACQRLGRRGLLVTGHTESIPTHLPAGVRHVTYAPFSQLLPRCAALVHHGGVGTSAQALLAGIPQLVSPLTHDQLDNAERLRRLGVAARLDPPSYNGARVAAVMNTLLNDREISESTRRIALQMRGVDSLTMTCQLLEELQESA